MDVGMGFSSAADPAVAVQESLAEAVAEVMEPQVCFVFAAGSYDLEAVQQQVAGALPDVPFIGGSVPGLMVRGTTALQGIGVLALKDVGLTVQTVAVSGADHDSETLGEAVGQMLQRGSVMSGTAFVFAAPIASMEPTNTLRALHGQLGPQFSYAGAILGPVLFTDAGLLQDGLAALAVAGPEIYTGMGHGLQPLPEPMLVTKTGPNSVWELDGQPASRRYAEVIRRFEPQFTVEDAAHYPMGIPSRGGRFLMRDVLEFSENGALHLAAAVPKHSVAVAMNAETRGLTEAAGDAAQRALSKHPNPQFMLVFDCISRYTLLNDDFAQEIQAIEQVAAGRVEILGLLTYGEISSSEGTPLLYNKSVVFAVGGSS